MKVVIDNTCSELLFVEDSNGIKTYKIPPLIEDMLLYCGGFESIISLINERMYSDKEDLKFKIPSDLYKRYKEKKPNQKNCDDNQCIFYFSYYDGCKFIKSVITEDDKQYKPPQLFKWFTLDNNKINTIKNSEIYLAKVTDFNDPLDTQIHTKNELFNNPKGNDYIEKIHNTKVCCFSQKNPLSLSACNMWGLYADNGKGICIEYEIDKNDLIEHYKAALKVILSKSGRFFFKKIKYIKDKNILNDLRHIFKNSQNRNIDTECLESYERTMFFEKDMSWQHEEESRLVYIGGSLEEDSYKYKWSKVKSIYIGWNFEENDKKLKDELNSFIKNNNIQIITLIKKFDFEKNSILTIGNE